MVLQIFRLKWQLVSLLPSLQNKNSYWYDTERLDTFLHLLSFAIFFLSHLRFLLQMLISISNVNDFIPHFACLSSNVNDICLPSHVNDIIPHFARFPSLYSNKNDIIAYFISFSSLYSNVNDISSPFDRLPSTLIRPLQ